MTMLDKLKEIIITEERKKKEEEIFKKERMIEWKELKR